MLTAEQLAGLIVALFWAILVSFLAYALLRLARLLRETSELVSDLTDRAAPLLEDMTVAVRRANEQLGRTDVITRQAAGITQNVSAVTTVVSSVFGGPVIKAAAFSYGVRKALGYTRDTTRRSSRAELPARRAAEGRGRR
ncbi:MULTISPECIES: DUF948 domain-containing protein [Thermomonospora]|uniref:Secreted protein n=1 Tax=Thermomonospora curvata (strain ATCC 19995 / DSM 43183 / JCM 3096 / KCTC 9072 / NBRC 15933 / NCIMB 10081 / Henssen B9) TaxID=471852 RepID=D1AEX4_THECD|nr:MULTISPECIES: DUF948 domain-containing protein [Thermomonospora]ACY97699.1 hypothetical protein Tcur_2133 [Thermomonospora curvata DSM 43183]PKK14442.1 MAG: DUF948 domain-containing protein [Thermomonospora sp. CIF 1]